MNVCVDQPRQQSAVSKIDRLRALGMPDSRTGLDYAIALDEYFTWPNRCPCDSIDHSRGAHDNRTHRLSLCGHQRAKQEQALDILAQPIYTIHESGRHTASPCL